VLLVLSQKEVILFGTICSNRKEIDRGPATYLSIALDGNHLHTAHSSSGGVGAVGSAGDQANIAVRVTCHEHERIC
jgi:hypothetical protein